MRRAFTMELADGAMAEYRARHERPWPELLAAIAAAGVREFSIFDAGEGRLVVSSEVTDEQAWERVWASPVHERWGAQMAPLLRVDEHGAPVGAELEEIYHFDAEELR